MRAAAALLVMLLAASPAAAQIAGRSMSGPPPFGLLLGDVFTLTSRIDVAAPYKLDPASLPKPGPVTYWLDLRGVELEEKPSPNGGRRYEIRARYQTFYAPLETIERTVPALKLAVTDGAGGRVETATASWSFLTSPLRPIVGVAGGGGAYSLRPDAVAVEPSLRDETIMVAAAGVGALAALLLLAWTRAWPPFHSRPARPFARAARIVAKAAREGEAGWRPAILALHRAFDASAGRRLLGEDLQTFLADRPAFRPLTTSIEAFFAASRAAFFGGRAAPADLPPGDLTRLARDLAAAERAS